MTLMNGVYDVTLRFLAPQIADAICLKYFDGIKMQGRVDQGFLERINGTMICLTCAMLCHARRALQTWIYKKPTDFKHDVVGGKVSESWSVLSGTKIANGSRKTQDLYARQKNRLRVFEKATQDLFILNLRQTMTPRLEKQHSVRQERREGFTDDNDGVYAELQRHLAMSTQGQTSGSR